MIYKKSKAIIYYGTCEYEYTGWYLFGFIPLYVVRRGLEKKVKK